MAARDCGKNNDFIESGCSAATNNELHEENAKDPGIINVHFDICGVRKGAVNLFRGKKAREQAESREDGREWSRLARDSDKNKQKIYCYVLQGLVKTCKLVSCKHYALCHA